MGRLLGTGGAICIGRTGLAGYLGRANDFFTKAREKDMNGFVCVHLGIKLHQHNDLNIGLFFFFFPCVRHIPEVPHWPFECNFETYFDYSVF